MHTFSSLKSFTRSLINYIGHGYTYAQISKIPEGKDIGKITRKISKKYKTDITRGQRQHRKRQGLPNYTGLLFGRTIVILRTACKEEDGEQWKDILGSKICFKKLCIVPYKDERGKLSIRIGKPFLKELRGFLEHAIMKRNQKNFQTTITFIYNLHKTIRYRGVQLQVSELLRYTKELQKKHGTKYHVPHFFGTKKAETTVGR